ncbi:MAG TPA: hypothetical protein DHV28_08560 [Ignavibacteriales bacterium]|nr:hypothetical protein [Ignavibacteriales bacterium]
MSYCRFENTFPDLQDCFKALSNEGLESLSETEKKYALKLIKVCRDLTDDFEDEMGTNGN